MLMTEEQAKEKRCCQTLADPCLASGCMAWRWAPSKWVNKDGMELDFDPREPDAVETKLGYCGLASRPDK